MLLAKNCAHHHGETIQNQHFRELGTQCHMLEVFNSIITEKGTTDSDDADKFKI